jgi:hypothetical protein
MGRIQNNTSFICCIWEYKMVQLFWKTIWQFLIKLNIQPTTSLLRIYQKVMKNQMSVYKYCHSIFIDSNPNLEIAQFSIKG